MLKKEPLLTNIKDLLNSWANQQLPGKDYYQSVLSIWNEIKPSNKTEIGQLNIESKELVINVSDHLLRCDLQFQTRQLLDLLNENLKKQNLSELNKIRFRSISPR